MGYFALTTKEDPTSLFKAALDNLMLAKRLDPSCHYLRDSLAIPYIQKGLAKLSQDSFITSCKTIVQRYQQELESRLCSIPYPLQPIEGDETSDEHLLWMLHELMYNHSQSETKKHRWLGYIQGIMIAKKYLSVQEERDLTRTILAGL